MKRIFLLLALLLGGVAQAQPIGGGCPSVSCPSNQLAINSGSTQTLTPGSVVIDTMTASTAFTLASGLSSNQFQVIFVELHQGGSAGYTPSFTNCPAGGNWAGGIVPAFNTIAGQIDQVQATSTNGGAAWTCALVAGAVSQPAVPSIPTNLTATPLTSYQIQLAANAVTANPAVTGYNIYRSTTPGGETLVASNQALPYTDTGLAQNTKYYYQITAVNSVGEGAKSAEASATTNAAPHGAHLAMTGTTAGLGYVDTAYNLFFVPQANSISVRARISPTSATGSFQALWSIWTQGTASASVWLLGLTSAGKIELDNVVGANAIAVADSTANPTFSAGVPLWVRGDCAPTTGACTFWTSTDDNNSPTNWVQLGTSVTATNTGTGITGSNGVGVLWGNTWGASGTLPYTGDFYASQLFINGAEVTAPAVNTSTPSGCAVLDSFSFTYIISPSHASCP